MAFLQREQPVPQAEIIALAFHVDYWNRLGWRDEFSSPQFSARQADYASKFKLGSVYTPQMVVDGRFEFVGNNSGTATKNIFEAVKSDKAVLNIERKGENLILKAENLPKHDAVNVFLAIAEDGLSTKVEAGENRGRTLEHLAVVRELRELGRISANENSFQTEFQVAVKPNWKKENLRLVIFLQENKSRQILGVLSVGSGQRTVGSGQ